MKNDTAKLNGFSLSGCWKELASERPERRRGSRKLSKLGIRGFIKAKSLKPQAWEFTDYPENQMGLMVRRHRRRVGRIR